MLPTTIRSPPSLQDHIPLAEYQSQTPVSFSHGKPVLHFHLEQAGASIPKSQCGTLAIFPADSPEEASTNGDAEQVVRQTVDVFVNSECVARLARSPSTRERTNADPSFRKEEEEEEEEEEEAGKKQDKKHKMLTRPEPHRSFTLFSPETNSGVSIPYPSISIHAVKQLPAQGDGSASTPSIWMQLEFSDGGAQDDDFNTVELTISPADAADAQKLYDAIANCSNLHPDPANDDDEQEGDCDGIVFEGAAAAEGKGEALQGLAGVLRGATDGGLPPPMPGSRGWITADNVYQYFDDEGNYVGGDGDAGPGEAEAEELGGGAGRTRLRDEVDGGGVNGAEDSESKRWRVE